MKLLYLAQRITIEFLPLLDSLGKKENKEKDAKRIGQIKNALGVNVIFLLRSVLGANLKSLCCIQKNVQCSSCAFCASCAYAVVFESPKQKDTQVLKGRDKALHPYLIRECLQNKQNKKENNYTFEFLLFGSARQYFPYIFGALQRAGEWGVGKKRIKFKISSIKDSIGHTILETSKKETVLKAADFCVWDTEKKLNDFSGTWQQKTILVQLLSPLRFKVQGKYTKEFLEKDFFMCLWRRANTLIALYGEDTQKLEKAGCVCDTQKMLPCNFLSEFSGEFLEGSIKITQRHLKWTEYEHYSARQKTAMKLGGVTGSFVLQGDFKKEDILLLDFAKIFGAGKNTNFGFGNLDYKIL